MIGSKAKSGRREGIQRVEAVVALLFVCTGLVQGASAAVGWEVLESSAELLHLRITVSGERITDVATPTDPVAWVEVAIEGASAVGEPGLPLLPRDARWIVLPPQGNVSMELRAMRVEPIGKGRVVPHAVASLLPETMGETGTTGPRLIEERREGEGYASFRSPRVDAIALDEPVYQRRQRMASLRIDPVLYDAASGALEVIREVEVLVRFERTPNLESEPGNVDEGVRGAALNPEQASAWRTLSPELRAKREQWARAVEERIHDGTLGRRIGGVAVFDPSTLLADPIRIRTSRTGIVRMRVDDLVNAHGLPSTVSRRQIRLVQLRGSDPTSPVYPAPLAAGVPLHFLGSPDESQPIASTDEIFFHAFSTSDDRTVREIDGDTFPLATPERADHYNSENVYFLLVSEPGVEGWERFGRTTMGPSQGTNVATEYRRRDLFGEDTAFQDDPAVVDVDRYHWNPFDTADVRRSLELRHPVPGRTVDVTWIAGPYRLASSGVTLDFSVLQGSTEVPLLTQTLSPTGRMFLMSGQFGSSVIGNGPVTFRMNRRVGDLSVLVLSFLESVELEYDALYRATNDRLDFDLPTAEDDYDVLVPGFSREDLLLFDVTDPRRPTVVDLTAANLRPTEGSPFVDFTLSLRVEQEIGQRRRFLAAPRIRFDRVTSTAMERDRVADLFSVVDDLQVLAIGPEFLRAEAQRWVDFRRERVGGRDWNVGYVDVQQIYDQFTGGLQSPHAIRSFLEWAYVNWDARAALLVGDANEDARGVSPNAGANLVPVQMHVQTSAGPDSRELMGSDKWYGIFDYTGTRYPIGLRKTSDLVIGRLTVSTPEQLRAVVDKIIAYENPQASDSWRNRTLWMADDAYATGFIGGSTESCYQFRSSELRFLSSQRLSADLVAASADSTIGASLYDLDEFTRRCRSFEPGQCESRSQVITCFGNNYRSELVDRLSQGWLIVSYQGHADFNVLAHEDIMRETTFSILRNEGRPFLFFGMGCHVTDFLRSRGATTSVPGTSMSEIMFLLPGRGAIAVYGSSGFEFLEPNAVFMEVIASSFFGPARTTSAVFGDDLRSRWVLGEALTQAELDVYARNPSLVSEMVAQYNILGDPLLRMDAAPARLQARRGGTPLGDGATIVADAGAGTASIAVTAVDESGIRRIEVVDDQNRDYSSLLPTTPGPDRRRAAFTLDLPIHPQRYQVEIVAFDESYPELRRSVLRLAVPVDVELRADGTLVEDPAQLVLASDRRTALEIALTSPVDLQSEEIELVMDGVDFFGEIVEGAARDWTVRVDAQPRGDVEVGALTLRLRGLDTVLGQQSGPPDGGAALVVSRHAAIPNPMRDVTNITAEVQGPVERVRLSVYDLAGRAVFEREFDPAALVDTVDGVNGRALAFQWDGRDRRGDELANGTYLYRLEVSGLGGRGRSEMGRLVIMR